MKNELENVKNLESEPKKSAQANVSNEIWKTLWGEWSISQMIWDIDNERVRFILEYYLNNKTLTTETLMKEISIYYEEVEPKLWDEKLKQLFELLINKKRILPSSIVKEFKNRDEILMESDPEVKRLMEISLEKKWFPSLILRRKYVYEKLAGVTDEDSKKIILYYLESWLSPELVNDEYEDYVYIKNYEYKNENLKNFIISLIDNNNNVNPSLVAFFFDIFKDWTEFWEDDKKYIIWLINTRWL